MPSLQQPDPITGTLTCPHCGAEVKPQNKPLHIEWHETIVREIVTIGVRTGVLT